MDTLVEKALAKFDEYNQNDPNKVFWQGKQVGQEYFLAQQLHRWVITLSVEPSVALCLASKCQHIGRWELPRLQYPEGKAGYLNWRKAMAQHHFKVASEILGPLGFAPHIVERLGQIIQKQQLKLDPEVQVIENALCLVFLEYQYETFFPKYDGEKVIQILLKSLKKMDSQGHSHALKLNFSEQGLEYVQQALRLL